MKISLLVIDIVEVQFDPGDRDRAWRGCSKGKLMEKKTFDKIVMLEGDKAYSSYLLCN